MHRPWVGFGAACLLHSYKRACCTWEDPDNWRRQTSQSFDSQISIWLRLVCCELKKKKNLKKNETHQHTPDMITRIFCHFTKFFVILYSLWAHLLWVHNIILFALYFLYLPLLVFGIWSCVIFLFHGFTQHPSLAQSASKIQSRGGRQVACLPVRLLVTYSPKGKAKKEKNVFLKMLYHSYHMSGPAYPLAKARCVKMSTAGYNIKKKKKQKEWAWEKKEKRKMKMGNDGKCACW